MIKKYLNEIGVAHILSKLDEYPDNEILATVITAIQEALEEKASINSPTFTGQPTTSNPDSTNYSTRIPTTQFVQDKMNNLAHNENSTTASQNYTTGQYVCVQGSFYKVIDDIAENDTFIINTNIEATTVGEQLQILMAAVFT